MAILILAARVLKAYNSAQVDSFVETFARYVGPFRILSLVIDFQFKSMFSETRAKNINYG